jgi:hypothetical protein
VGGGTAGNRGASHGVAAQGLASRSESPSRAQGSERRAYSSDDGVDCASASLQAAGVLAGVVCALLVFGPKSLGRCGLPWATTRAVAWPTLVGAPPLVHGLFYLFTPDAFSPTKGTASFLCTAIFAG